MTSTGPWSDLAPRLASYALVVLRGLPGVGKTTFARTHLPDRFLIEADQFFSTAGGQYQWHASQASTAHRWCLATVQAHLECRHAVVVANTLVKRLMLSEYIRLLHQFPALGRLIVVTLDHSPLTCEQLAHRTELTGHAVPLAVIERMQAAWEPCEDEYVLTPEPPPC